MKNIEFKFNYALFRDGNEEATGLAKADLSEYYVKKLIKHIKDGDTSGLTTNLPDNIHQKLEDAAWDNIMTIVDLADYDVEDIVFPAYLPIELVEQLPEDVQGLLPKALFDQPRPVLAEDSCFVEEEYETEDENAEEDYVEDEVPYTLTIPVPRYDLMQLAKGKGTEYTLPIYPENEDILIEYEEVEEDGETFFVTKTDDDDMSVPKKYDRLHFYSGKSPEGAHVIIEVTCQRVEQAADENGYPITYEEDGETLFLENVIFSLGAVIEKNTNPGKRTEAYEGPFLKCLATQQPWAQLIVTGIKDIECRRALPAKPGKVFIAASGNKLKWNELPSWIQEIYTKYEKKGILPAYDKLPSKCIIGHVDIVKASFDPVESIWGCDHDGMKYTLRNAEILDEPIYGKNKATPYFYNVEGYDEEHLPPSHKVDLSE